MKITEPILGSYDWDKLDTESVLENSFKDYHTKGLDYLCLQRGDLVTIKAYFFEDCIQSASEVVNPHDHRYNFITECVTGRIRNKWYTKEPKHRRPGLPFSAFTWHTPLNGGHGFTYSHEETLWEKEARTIGRGGQYVMAYNEIHTIQVLKPETCIILLQGIDRVDAGKPTWTYSSEPTEPVIDGLYNKFTADQAMKRINLLKDLVE